MRLVLIILAASFLCACHESKQPLQIENLLIMRQHVLELLLPLKFSRFSPVSMDKMLLEVQSPFVPRVVINNKPSSIQALSDLNWRLVGEVRQGQELLGVFLKSGHKAVYFGLGLSVLGSSWRVLRVTNHVVVFVHQQKHTQRTLRYD